MKPSSYFERLVDVMKELYKVHLAYARPLGLPENRYSERKEAFPELATTLAPAAMNHEAGQDETKDDLE